MDNHIAAASPSLARQEWQQNWTLVLACFAGFSFLTVMTGSLSMFMQPLSDEFGWSRTLIAAGFSISTLMTAALSPFFGLVVDRYGSRRMAIPGLVATALVIASFSLMSGSATHWILMWLLYAAISISVKTTVWTAAVAGVFKSSQGLALGVTLCGAAAAQAVLPPLVDWLINAFGWRATYVWLGCGWGGITLVLCLCFLFGAHERRTAKRVQERKTESGQTDSEPESARPDFDGLTIPEAWRDPALWRIAASTLIIMALTVGLTIHQIPILTEAGVSRTQAALLASLAGVAGVIGKLATGVLLDRYRPNWVGGITLAATALAFGLLIDGIASPALIIFAMLVNGYTQGTKLQINGYLTARYAGMRNFGSVYGFMNSLVAFGSGAGPVLAGLAYDSSGNYGTFLIVGTIGSLLCGILLLTLPAYPEWQPRDQEETSRA